MDYVKKIRRELELVEDIFNKKFNIKLEVEEEEDAIIYYLRGSSFSLFYDIENNEVTVMGESYFPGNYYEPPFTDTFDVKTYPLENYYKAINRLGLEMYKEYLGILWEDRMWNDLAKENEKENINERADS